MMNQQICTQLGAKRIVRSAIGIGGMLAALLLAGCASSDAQQPTHRWVSTKNASSAEYHVDNTQCTRQSGGDSNQRAFDLNSPEYQKYIDCMNARGYALTAFDSDSVSSR